MERMTGQTKIIVATACCLALVDIAVRAMTPTGTPCVSCVGMDNRGVLTAHAVRLVDNNGNVRGLWNTDAHGEPALWMYDRNGATRIELDATENTPSLSLHDNDGNRRVYLGMDNRDGTGLFQTIEDSKVVTFSFDGSTPSKPNTMSELEAAVDATARAVGANFSIAPSTPSTVYKYDNGEIVDTETGESRPAPGN